MTFCPASSTGTGETPQTDSHSLPTFLTLGQPLSCNDCPAVHTSNANDISLKVSIIKIGPMDPCWYRTATKGWPFGKPSAFTSGLTISDSRGKRTYRWLWELWSPNSLRVMVATVCTSLVSPTIQGQGQKSHVNLYFWSRDFLSKQKISVLPWNMQYQSIFEEESQAHSQNTCRWLSPRKPMAAGVLGQTFYWRVW